MANALVPRVPFTLNGRYRAVGVPLTQDDTERVQTIPELRFLCVSANVPFSPQPADLSAPSTSE